MRPEVILVPFIAPFGLVWLPGPAAGVHGPLASSPARQKWSDSASAYMREIFVRA